MRAQRVYIAAAAAAVAEWTLAETSGSSRAPHSPPLAVPICDLYEANQTVVNPSACSRPDNPIVAVAKVVIKGNKNGQ